MRGMEAREIEGGVFVKTAMKTYIHQTVHCKKHKCDQWKCGGNCNFYDQTYSQEKYKVESPCLICND